MFNNLEWDILSHKNVLFQACVASPNAPFTNWTQPKCTIAFLILSRFLEFKRQGFNFYKLQKATKQLTYFVLTDLGRIHLPLSKGLKEP